MRPGKAAAPALNRESQHHPRIFMLQQMAVRHIGKLFRRLVVKLHQHLADSTFNLTVSFQPARCASGALPFSENAELRAVNMERMQHHVAFT
jgi:hypothetical protein